VAIAMHYSLRPLEAAPVFTRFNYDVQAKFEVAQPIHCRFIAFYYCWYVTLHCNLDHWPCDLDYGLWLWTFVLFCLCSGQTLYQISAQSSNPWRSYSDFSIWPNDLEHVSPVALCSGI